LMQIYSGGHFMSLIIGDYVAGFLGISEGSAWNMEPFKVWMIYLLLYCS
jgi:linoleate 10R-lipoxygenase